MKEIHNFSIAACQQLGDQYFRLVLQHGGKMQPIAPGQFVELFYGGTEAQPWNDRLIGFNHLCFQVDDINAAARQIRDCG